MRVPAHSATRLVATVVAGASLVVLASVELAGCGGSERSVRPPADPRAPTLWNVVWHERGDSLAVERIDVVPGVPNDAKGRRARPVQAPGRGGAARPLPPSFQGLAPSPRDTRAVDATLVTVHDRDGRLLDSRVVTRRATVFLDRYDGPGGGPRPLEPETRAVTIPSRRDARFLVLHSLRFSRPGAAPDTDAGTAPWDGRTRFLLSPKPGPGQGEREAAIRTRVVVDLVPPRPDDFRGLTAVPDPDPTQLPGSLDLDPIGFDDPLDVLELLKRIPLWEWRPSEPMRLDRPLFPPAQGEVLGAETLWYPTESVYPVEGTPYRIAILGDGFDASDADQDRFRHYAEQYVAGFLAEPPFGSVRETVWIAMVRVASSESGISYCSDSFEAVDTYFRTRGCYVAEQPAACHPDDEVPGSDVPTYLGIDDADLWRVREAGRLAFDGKPAHLHVMIANCDLRGGRADPRPSSRTAFVTLPPAEAWYAVDSDCLLGSYASRTLDDDGRDSSFVAASLHESAHVMAGLIDEYIGKVAWDGTPWPNLATADEVGAGTVPWLATPSGSAPVHRYDIPPCDGSHNQVHDETAAAYDALGAYWGCAYVSAEAAASEAAICAWTDPAGRDFFRPEGRCKMRVTRWPFCRVCADTLKRAILDPRPIEDE